MSQQMARGRREIKKIEDKSSRQVTFSKRRAGLFKKAKELVVLCDATVLLFTFSPAGKLFEYCSSNMEMIMDKYLDYPPTSRSSISSTSDDNLHRNDMELVKMNQFCQDLTRICSQMNGADLESLDLKQLQELEDGLAGGLKRIKSRKDELLMMQIQEYLQREPELTQENRNLGALSGQRQPRTVMEFTSLGNLEMPGDCRNQRSNDDHHNGEKEVIQDNLTSLHLGLPDVQ